MGAKIDSKNKMVGMQFRMQLEILLPRSHRFSVSNGVKLSEFLDEGRLFW